VGFDNMPNYTREDATDALTATVTLIRPAACMTHITTMVTIPRFEYCDLGRWRQSLSRYCVEKDETQRPINSEDRSNI